MYIQYGNWYGYNSVLQHCTKRRVEQKESRIRRWISIINRVYKKSSLLKRESKLQGSEKVWAHGEELTNVSCRGGAGD